MPVSLHNSQYTAHSRLANQKPEVGKVAEDGGYLHPTTAEVLGERFLERFWVFVQKTPTCWLWTAGVDAYGYGQIARIGKSPIKTHRAMWILRHGPITSAQHVLHKCDVPNCVNPDHLFLGNQDLNMKDAAAKGRLVGHRKLTDAQILEIRGRYVRRQNGRQLAREFGVSVVTLCRIAAGTQRRRMPVEERAVTVSQ